MDDTPLIPLPGQRQLHGIDPEIPETKSRQAALDGLSLADCPYADKRGGDHRHVVTYSRSFIKYWRDGFQSVRIFPHGGRRDGASDLA